MKYLKAVLVGVAAIAAWSALAGWLAFDGWWMRPVANRGDAAAFTAWAVAEVEAKNRGTHAFLLIEDGVIVSRHFAAGVDEHTLFPTASFSKWIAALAVMSLVEQKRLDLDAPIETYLSRWQLPDSEFDPDGVTARRLLSHTAGLTDGLGFGDYEPDEPVPSLEASLRNPRASSGEDVAVAVGREPGSAFGYSGGGYLILELVVEEVTGERFADYVQRSILEPLGMTRSTYAYLGDLDNVSRSYDQDGSLVPSYRYASNAATGLASSAADLAKLLKGVLQGVGLPLELSTLAAMREPHGFVLGSGIWGLGTILYVATPGGDHVFGHDGANDPALNTSVRTNPETADGIVMLVSGHPTLASDIGSEWVLWQTGAPDFLSTERTLESAFVPILFGSMLIVLLVVLWLRRRSH
ncbi:MAG: serine hydrolase domain-containing protein [Pseudomonadota bacterium]